MASTAVRSSPIPPTGNANKRKRGMDHDTGRNAKVQNTNGDTGAGPDPNYAALLQGIGTDALTGGPDDNTRTAQAALATPMTQSAYPDPSPFEGTPSMPPSFDDGTPSQNPMGSGTAQALFDARQAANKPQVGTQEWHQQRKDNHKEVERRRREVINEGIENIAKVVPGTEKNKGAILQRTCQYIAELQAQITSHENTQATVNVVVKELESRNLRLKESAERAWADSAKWQQRCRDSGLQFDDYDDGGLGGVDEADITA